MSCYFQAPAGTPMTNPDLSLLDRVNDVIDFPTLEGSNIGFRLARIPEPGAMVLTLLFGAGLVCRRKR